MQDLRSRAGRDLLERLEGQHRDACASRSKVFAVGGAFFVAVVAGVILFALMPKTAKLALPLGVAAGVALWPILERALYRPRFPFLDGLPPTDRP